MSEEDVKNFADEHNLVVTKQIITLKDYKFVQNLAQKEGGIDQQKAVIDQFNYLVNQNKRIEYLNKKIDFNKYVDVYSLNPYCEGQVYQA